MEKDETSGEICNEEKVTMTKLTVKFSGRSIPLNLSLDSTIKDLKILLQPLTNVLPRGQKLIFSGEYPFSFCVYICMYLVQLQLKV